jgi:hypothetical protein
VNLLFDTIPSFFYFGLGLGIGLGIAIDIGKRKSYGIQKKKINSQPTTNNGRLAKDMANLELRKSGKNQLYPP